MMRKFFGSHNACQIINVFPHADIYFLRKIVDHFSFSCVKFSQFFPVHVFQLF